MLVIWINWHVCMKLSLYRPRKRSAVSPVVNIAVYNICLCIAGNSTASLQEEIKQKACDTEGEHIETLLTCKTLS